MLAVLLNRGDGRLEWIEYFVGSDVNACTDPHEPSSARDPRKVAGIPSPVPSDFDCCAPVELPPAGEFLQSAMREQFSPRIPRRCIESGTKISRFQTPVIPARSFSKLKTHHRDAELRKAKTRIKTFGLQVGGPKSV